MFCNVSPDCVISNTTLPDLYEVPLMLHEQKMDEVVCRNLGLECKDCDLTLWKEMVSKIYSRKGEINIALVGKYVKLHDSYLSVVESLNHASFVVGKKVKIKWVDSDTVTEESASKVFEDVQGIILPGGFGTRGIEGMILSCKYARENNLPYFGICLGMQIMVIEYARNVLNLKNANSREFDENSNDCVIDLMENQKNVKKGGSMRLGKYKCLVKKDTALYKAYNIEEIEERHRHRYEFNNQYREKLEEKGLVIAGTSPDNTLVEAVELNRKEFFVGVQFHPEFKSRPNKAHPLFVDFVKSCGEKS